MNDLFDLIQDGNALEAAVTGDGTKTRQIVELLKHRHCGPEWAHFVELTAGTGAYAHGRIDFYAFNLWPSKRYLKVAYEIKVSRGDFARELKDPRKRETAEKVSDECYFAVPVGLVSPDEVPEGWGLIEMTAGGMRVKKRAMQRDVKSLPLTFMAAMARRLADPPPSMPEAVWLMAGKELSAEQLQQFANKDVLDGVHKRIREAQDKERDRYKEKEKPLAELLRVIQDRIGWSYGNASRLSEWFDEHLKAESIELDWKTRSLLRNLNEKISELLQEDKNKNQ